MYSLYNGINATELEPSEFSVGQNYPNPFKEKTVIKYCVAYKTRVQIVVYDSEGKEIEKLINEEKKPGTYEVEFSTLRCHSGESRNLPAGRQGLPNGDYFYQMFAGNYSSDKKWFCINNQFGRLNMKTLLQTLFSFFLVTQICFAQWTQVGLNEEIIMDLAVQNQNIFAVTEDNGKLYRSTDNGANYTMIDDSTRNVSISPTGKVFIIKDAPDQQYRENIFTSLDNGTNWMMVNIVEQIQDSLYVQFFAFTKITVSSTGIIFCTLRVGIRGDWVSDLIAKSSDDGLTWTTPGIGMIGGRLFDFRNQFSITLGEESIEYGDGQSFIYLSTDNGNTWNYLGFPAIPSSELYSRILGLFSNGNILAGGSMYDDSLGLPFTGILLSTDMCSTWTQISSLNSQVGLSWSNGSSEGMLVGTPDLGVFLFSDEGDSLGSRNEGLTNLNIQTLTLDNHGYVYAGTGNGVWRRPLTEVTPVVENQIPIPSSFNLLQNFPNPFNPSTKIKYSIPQSANVSIKVFDIIGNEIETLVNEEKPVGTYEITWQAANLPSGVYFYQLKASDYVSTKKMLLLK